MSDSTFTALTILIIGLGFAFMALLEANPCPGNMFC